MGEFGLKQLVFILLVFSVILFLEGFKFYINFFYLLEIIRSQNSC